MHPRIYDDIRKAIRASDKRQRRLSQETGIGEPQLCDFMKGVKGLSVEALERLAAALDLEVIARARKPARRKQKGG